MSGTSSDDQLIQFLGWLAEGCPQEPDAIVSICEYRLLCSGVLKPAGVMGNWSKSDGARLLLNDPVTIIVASQPFDDHPQELVLRFPCLWGQGGDRTIASDLASVLTLLTRRLITVYAKTRSTFDREKVPTWAGLQEWMEDWPSPIANAKAVCWEPRPISVVTGRDETYVQFHNPGPRGFDAGRMNAILRWLPEWEHAATFVRAARLYASAMEQIEARPEAAYQLLISAVDSLASATLVGWPTREDVLEFKKDSVSKLMKLGIAEDAAHSAVLELDKGNSWTKRKFTKFLMDRCNWPGLQSPDDLFLVPDFLVPNEEAIGRSIKMIYDQRSGATHSGRTFPPSAKVGSSPWIPHGAADSVLENKPAFPPVGWFERVVNSAIMNLVESSSGCQIAEAVDEPRGHAT